VIRGKEDVVLGAGYPVDSDAGTRWVIYTREEVSDIYKRESCVSSCLRGTRSQLRALLLATRDWLRVPATLRLRVLATHGQLLVPRGQLRVPLEQLHVAGLQAGYAIRVAGYAVRGSCQCAVSGIYKILGTFKDTQRRGATTATSAMRD